jgi:hypothetical protein
MFHRSAHGNVNCGNYFSLGSTKEGEQKTRNYLIHALVESGTRQAGASQESSQRDVHL